MNPTHIIVHCSATQPIWMSDATAVQQMKEIDKWHREDRGWRMIGYHAFISRNGEVVQGREYSDTGAHAKGWINKALGICLAGGFGSDAEDRALEHYTPVQLAALYDLIKKLQKQYNIKNDNVIGHNKIALSRYRF